MSALPRPTESHASPSAEIINFEEAAAALRLMANDEFDDDDFSAPDEPTSFSHDAEIWGEMSPELAALPIGLSVAENRYEKAWFSADPAPFKDVFEGMFAQHKIGKKEGRCFVTGTLGQSKRRTKNNVLKNYLMGIDVDSGASLEDCFQRVRAAGLTCILYTTHSHGSTGIEIAQDRFHRWAEKSQIDTTPTTESVRRYMHEETAYVADVCDSAKFIEKRQDDGMKLIIQTIPVPKFRMLFPLAAPFVYADEDGAHKDVINSWSQKVLGLAQSFGVDADPAARDPSRLFYLPRHDKGAANFRIMLTCGRLLRFEDIPSAKPHDKLNNDPFDRAATDMGAEGGKEFVSPNGVNLKKWARDRSHGFDIAQVFRDNCDDKIRAEQSDSKLTITCPFDDDHGNPGDPEDQGCFVQSAGADAETFSFHCAHAGCSGRDRLTHMQKAMQDGWFPDSVLTDPTYDLAGIDDEESDLNRLLGIDALFAKAHAEKQRDGAVPPETMEALMDSLSREANRVPFYDRVKVLKLTGVTAFREAVERRAKKYAKESAKAARAKASQAGSSPTIWSEDDFPAQCDALLRGLRRLNDPPYMFLHGGDMKRLPGEAENGAIADFLKKMSFTDFKTECNDAVTYVVSSESKRVASLADDIPAHLWGMRDKPVPVADRFTRVPIFAPDGTLRTEDGYDAATRTILQTSGLNIDPVPFVPSDTDVKTAKDWLFGKALADFPFVDNFGGSEGGDGSSSRAHVVVMMLQQIARGLYTGPTPFFFIDKPQPGTGASLLVELLYQIIVGRPASPQVLGKNEEEVRKGITSKLMGGSPIIFYDNVRNKIHGEALATLGTADWWEDRKLGGNDTYVGPNRALTVFTGNNMTMADEMVRRMLPIRLDAQMSEPESRVGFVISDLRKWMVECRSDLVWSCLVLVQNWISAGRKRSTVHLASYEDFAAVMGGILEAAGIDGFLANLNAFRASAKIEAVDESDVMQELLDAYPLNPFSTNDAHDVLYDGYGRLRFPSLNINEDSTAAQKRILGMRLRNHVGRRFKLRVKGHETEVRFESAGQKDHAAQWQFTRPTG
ncbi:MAG: hypothetical protein E5Y06_10555 [Mesorhizobium sp.]|uniref:hypothetical protein n=1 Tax=Mesorhizobium sp. TaxID=1871066 RepID=UPI001223D744|nr:hypothetical protein [Mesorhizobium sp.]TIN95688.1 MAG: hypothetical protein E5Y06_10555 [Mesorhizobium sp.]TJU98493.1 MAG: hypothetical protein E5Y08_13465 [Mesorhizobium sp.]